MNIYLAEEEVKGKREVVGAQRFPFDAFLRKAKRA